MLKKKRVSTRACPFLKARFRPSKLGVVLALTGNSWRRGSQAEKRVSGSQEEMLLNNLNGDVFQLFCSDRGLLGLYSCHVRGD